MECETCKYWLSNPLIKGVWGKCRLLASGDADKVDIYGNDRDGAWVEIEVETLPDFFCACYEEK